MQAFNGQANALAFLSTVSEGELFAALGTIVKMRAYRRAKPHDFTPEPPLTPDEYMAGHDRLMSEADDAWDRTGEWARREEPTDKPVLNPHSSHDAIV